ncbi:MAG: PfkB family carbohydrate kinase, partial [Cyclobacteriaceae bacterium]
MSKKYDVYGIGNALVDIVTEVDNAFFEKNEIEKGVMTLVDEKRQLQLMKAIDSKKSRMSAGGSAANTVIGVNQFGGKSFYSCLVAQDELGKFFLEDMKRNGVDTNLSYEDCPKGHSGRCLVMTTPDADRTKKVFMVRSASGVVITRH